MLFMYTYSYLLSCVHTKVFPAVCGLHKEDDALFKERCANLRGKLSPEYVGMSEDYYCSYHKTIQQLNNIQSMQSPLEGLYIFQDALVLLVGVGVCICA